MRAISILFSDRCLWSPLNHVSVISDIVHLTSVIDAGIHYQAMSGEDMQEFMCMAVEVEVAMCVIVPPLSLKI